MEASGLEKITDPQKRFRWANWFNQEVGRSSVQRAFFGFLTCISSQYYDRQKTFKSVRRTKHFQNSKPIHVRHDEIEQNQVRIKSGTGFERLAGIRKSQDATITFHP